MSGFGARARQAEYEAATNAKQRQVSREAEEQKLPPKPAPISLSAFTRVPQASRNKGNKAWKPLTLDDIGDDLDDTVQEDFEQLRSPTPFRTAREDISPLRHQTRILLRNQPQMINVNIPTISVPTGPRVQRVPKDPMLNFPHHGGFPYPNFQLYAYPPPMYAYANLAGSPQIGFHGIPRELKWQSSHRYGGVMAPNDISPTKQEDKLAMLSKVPDAVQYEDFPGQTTYYPPYIETPCRLIPSDGNSFISHPQYRMDVRNNGDFIQYGLPQDDPNPNSNLESDRLSNPAGVRNLLVGSTDLVRVQTPLRAVSENPSGAIKAGVGPVQDAPSSSRVEAAAEVCYDRRSEMQSYITTSTQKAMARTTKTVLNNPELRKEPMHSKSNVDVHVSNQGLAQNPLQQLRKPELKLGSRPLPRVPWIALPPAQSQKAVIAKLKLSPTFSPRKLQGIALAINNPAPGLTLADVDGCKEPQEKKTEPASSSEDDSEMPFIFSDRWCEPAAPNRASRERIRRLMARAAAEIGGGVSHAPLELFKQAAQSESMESSAEIWFQEDKRGVRTSAIETAQQNGEKTRYDMLLRNGGRLLEHFDDGFAANLLVNEVSLNVRSYRDRQSLISEQQRHFYKVKPVPEYAIEKGGLFIGGPQIVSYFDDNQEGFGTAPVRIARDPRFRPHGKDGSKIKLEEEWKHRQEMYGRKISDSWNI